MNIDLPDTPAIDAPQEEWVVAWAAWFRHFLAMTKPDHIGIDWAHAMTRASLIPAATRPDLSTIKMLTQDPSRRQRTLVQPVVQPVVQKISPEERQETGQLPDTENTEKLESITETRQEAKQEAKKPSPDDFFGSDDFLNLFV